MTAYRKLFSVNVRHNYYEDGLSNDLAFIPAQKVKYTLRNQRWILRNIQTGFNLVCETGNDNKAIIGIDKISLQFGIVLINPAKFSAVTVLDQTAPAKLFSSSKKMYFTNNGLDEELQYSILDGIIPEIYKVNFAVALSHTAITLRLKSAIEDNVTIAYDTEGLPVPGPYHVMRKADKTFEQLLNLRNLPDGLYTVSIKNAADTGADLVTYSFFKSNELSSQPNFGVLEINWPETDTAITEKKFFINFARKSTTWKYYVINRSGIDLDNFDLVINDNEENSDPVYEKYNFPGNLPPADDADPINKIAGSEIMLFKSNKKIPFYSEVKKGLKLSKVKSGDETTLIENLPNPTPEKQSGDESKIYIYV